MESIFDKDKRWRKVLAAFLSFVLVFSLWGFPAYAANEADDQFDNEVTDIAAVDESQNNLMGGFFSR